MFLAVDRTDLALMPLLRHSMFSDRASQFVARHGWALDLDTAGLEIDEYDDTLATYCIVEGEHRHRASVRLRTAATGSMVEHHFPELWRTDLSERVEITRFCAAPDLGLEDRLTAVADLLLGLCRHCQRTGIRSIFGVVFPAVARVIRQAGWAGEVIAQQESPGGTLLLVDWVPSNLVAWTIQEKLEARENALAARRRAEEMPLAA